MLFQVFIDNPKNKQPGRNWPKTEQLAKEPPRPKKSHSNIFYTPT